MATRKEVQELDAKRAELVKEWRTLAARVRPSIERIEEIKAELEELPVLKYDAGDGVAISVTQGSTFKPDLFTKLYPITARPELYKAVPDLDRIKANMSPAETEAFYAAAKKSVKLA